MNTQETPCDTVSSPPEWPVALTIAGSDSGGGAGIQADLKTFQSLGVFGTCAVTCLTAQNPDTVSRVEPVAPGMISAQIAAVRDGFPVRAVKTGMLFSAEIIRAVALSLEPRFRGHLVVDPVMVATSGAKLLRDDAVAVLQSELLPLASVITPNLPEAEILCSHRIASVAELEAAAAEIGRKFGTACIAKGGHLGEAQEGANVDDGVVDILYVNGKTTCLTSPWVAVQETHGTGCTFSAALTAYLALGYELPAAFEGAKAFVGEALRGAVRVGRHYPLRIGPPSRMDGAVP